MNNYHFQTISEMAFQDLFMKTMGKPISYNGKEIMMSHHITLIQPLAEIDLEIISTDSEWIQGVVFKGIGTFEVDGKAHKFKTLREGIIFWENTKSNKIKLHIKIQNKKNIYL